MKSRKRVQGVTIIALLLLLVPTLAACGTTTTPGSSGTTKKIKVGLVTDIGGLNDRGFNALADLGLQNAQKTLGITADVKESKSGDDYVPNLTAYAAGGYDLVIAVGFLMQEAVGKVSGQFPNTHFAIIDGTATDASGNDLKRSNVQALFFKEQDAGALVGVIAGMLEKSGATPKKTKVISAVGGIKIPPVDHYIAGYKWGAQRIDPSINVLYGYSNSFTDSAKCRDLANSQISNKSEIVFQVAGGCGLGALQAAGQQGVYSIGVDTDQKTADASVIASAVKRVDVATFDAIKMVVDGKFTGGTTLFGLDNGGVGFAPGNLALPADITAQVTAISDQIKSGAVTVPSTL